MVTENYGLAVAGLRGALFTAASISASAFVREARPVWTLGYSLLWGKVQQPQIIALAAMGWFFAAISSMILTGPRLIDMIFYHRNPMGSMLDNDAIWTIVGFSGLTLGFYQPVFAMLWYRGRLRSALLLGVLDALAGMGCVWLAYTMHQA